MGLSAFPAFPEVIKRWQYDFPDGLEVIVCHSKEMAGRKKSKAKSTSSGYKKKQTQVGFNSGQQNFVDRQNEETNKVAKDEEEEKVSVATPPPKEETTTETPPREEALTTPPPSKLEGDHVSIVGGRDANNNKSSPKESLVTEEVTKAPVMDATPPASKPP